MKENRKRLSLSYSWAVFFFLCIFILSIPSFFTFRLVFTDYEPKVVPRVSTPVMEVISTEISNSVKITIRETVFFPDQVFIFLKYPPSTPLFTNNAIICVYLHRGGKEPLFKLSPVSIDNDFDETVQIVKCALPPRGGIVTLAVDGNEYLEPGGVYKWDSLAYEAVVDRDGTTVVFVKGLNLRGGRVATSRYYKCLFGWDLSDQKRVMWTDVVSAAQEIVRCKTPLSVLHNPEKFSSGSRFNDSVKVSVRVVGRRTIGSVAHVRHRLDQVGVGNEKQHKMCVCTMLRNQARFLPEWIMYHGRMGVERWFLYDNNSDDGIESVVEGLAGSGYNVTRHAWPWLKTQEAGFAHCALRARDSCEWVGFIDVDEFLHLSSEQLLSEVLGNQSRPSEVAELRVPCHSFGPSGLKEHPSHGVTTGYTCRLAAPERHKSIVRPEALNTSLINVVHHFHLKSGYRHENMNKSMLVINHYKYQVWGVFKEKFVRRVATYVSDWQQDTNVGSKDRAPGLGTKAVEPSDWATRFCEVNDTGLRDLVLETFPNPNSGLLPWENHPEW